MRAYLRVAVCAVNMGFKMKTDHGVPNILYDICKNDSQQPSKARYNKRPIVVKIHRQSYWPFISVKFYHFPSPRYYYTVVIHTYIYRKY